MSNKDIGEPLLAHGAINDSMPNVEEDNIKTDLNDTIQDSHVFSGDEDESKDDTWKERNAIFKIVDPEIRKALPNTYLGNNREESDVLSR